MGSVPFTELMVTDLKKSRPYLFEMRTDLINCLSLIFSFIKCVYFFIFGDEIKSYIPFYKDTYARK